MIEGTERTDSISSILATMTDEEAREYFESLEADRWVDECKSNPDLM